MITFEKITYRNFLSTGSAGIEIDLNSYPTTYSCGKNAAGKCVHRDTKIKIMYDGSVRNSTVGEVADFYYSDPENNIGKLFVETRFGYKRILAADITARSSYVYRVLTDDGFELKVSPDHLLHDFDGESWIKARDLTIGYKISTNTLHGYSKIVCLELLDELEDLWDLQVEEVEEYYANDIVSHNSTIIDAITFVLFNKPFRKVNKSGLINSINKKDLLVELDFKVNSNTYKIIRGQKPNVFEIYSEGKLVNQEAESKDYQKYLENQILKLNYKSFTQIVILGSATYMPFMQLPAPNRREVIEDLLDITVFSSMNTLLKEKSSSLKKDITIIQNDIQLLKQKFSVQENYIESLSNQKEINNKELYNKIEKIDEELSEITEKANLLIDEEKVLRENISDILTEQNKNRSINNLMVKMDANIDSLKEKIDFFSANYNCPTCSQPITEDFKKENTEVYNEKLLEYSKAYKELEEKLNESNKTISEIRKKTSEADELKNKISGLRSTFTTLNRQKNNLLDEIKKSDESGLSVDIESQKKELKVLSKQIVKKMEDLSTANEDLTYHETSLMLLKDNGIKSQIIKQYIPVLNKFINHYINIMDFYVKFELDENFNETIKARHRDELSYYNLSEGQKRRIDIAILFSFRKLAELKNTCNTNLLLLDEVFDSSIDVEGTEHLINILKDFGNYNVIVISHKENLEDRFSRILKFSLKNDYSSLEEIKN